MALLHDAIFALLDGETAAESRVYPQQAPQRSALPYIIYQEVAGGVYGSQRGGGVVSNTRVQITCIAATHDQAAEMMDDVRVLLDAYRGTVGSTGITLGHVLLIDQTRNDQSYIDPENEQLTRFAKSEDYLFWHNLTTPNQ